MDYQELHGRTWIHWISMSLDSKCTLPAIQSTLRMRDRAAAAASVWANALTALEDELDAFDLMEELEAYAEDA